MQTDKIHILHLIDGLRMGGAEVMITQIIKALGTEKYKHFVYYFAQDGPIRHKLEAMGTLVYRGTSRASILKPIEFMTTFFYLVRDLASFIKCKRIQIIQSHLNEANQLAVTVGKLTGTPTFPTIHNTQESVDRRNKWDFRVYLIKTVNRVIYPFACRVVAVSEEVKEIIRQKYHLRDSKIAVLKNGIIFEDNDYQSTDLAKEFPGSSNKLKLFSAGRLAHQKAYEVLIKAVAELTKSGKKDIFVMIAGDGEEKNRLEALIGNLSLGSYIKLLGIRHDVMGLMKASDIFVLPSRFEGLSVAMIEAMACGLPIIASDVPGLNVYIKEGENGLQFPVEDHKALAMCILRLLKDEKLRLKLSCGARKSFKTEYDLYKNIEALDALFQNYCSRN
jgi:glycosyltransferase involved in cell wall biosynthesis